MEHTELQKYIYGLGHVIDDYCRGTTEPKEKEEGVRFMTDLRDGLIAAEAAGNAGEIDIAKLPGSKQVIAFGENVRKNSTVVDEKMRRAQRIASRTGRTAFTLIPVLTIAAMWAGKSFDFSLTAFFVVVSVCGVIGSIALTIARALAEVRNSGGAGVAEIDKENDDLQLSGGSYLNQGLGMAPYLGGDAIAGAHHDWSQANDDLIVNPANGLPMVGGIGGLDVSGNAYGVDSGIAAEDFDTSGNTFGSDSFTNNTDFGNSTSTIHID